MVADIESGLQKVIAKTLDVKVCILSFSLFFFLSLTLRITNLCCLYVKNWQKIVLLPAVDPCSQASPHVFNKNYYHYPLSTPYVISFMHSFIHKILIFKKDGMPKWNITVDAPAHRKYTTWFGGSTIAPLCPYITRDMFEEIGPAIVGQTLF